MASYFFLCLLRYPSRSHFFALHPQKNGQIREQNPSSFDWFPTVELTNQPKLADGSTSSPFPSVTLITPDAVRNDPDAFELALEVGDNIAYIDKSFTQPENVLRYEPTTGNWVSIAEVSTNQKYDYSKPLVLITDWRADSTLLNYNTGTAEAVADSVFASLVKLDHQLKGAFSTTTNIYNQQGDLIYTPGNLFNSPFHFIGFGSGAVVNSEIIQRIGTAFPKLDSDNKPTQFAKTFPDLQMTTIDGRTADAFSENNILEPTIEVWENVTFADNYYQSVSDFESEALKAADLNIALGGKEIVESRAGFTGNPSENEYGRNAHTRAAVWYEGTVNINQHDLGLTHEYPVHRRKGDFALTQFANTTYPWYLADDAKGNFNENNYQYGQWEGNGTGYYYSILGNGYSDRPSSVAKKRPVSDDNTTKAWMRGDFAVPTLFNGNFDAISYQNDTQPIPGWSFHNVDEVTAQSHLVDAKTLPSLTNYWSSLFSNNSPNYALELNPNENITHNNFVVPDWGVLRFNLHVPGLDTSAPILLGEIPLLKVSATDSETGEVYELSSRVTVKGEFLNSPRYVERASEVEIVYRDAPTVAAYRSNRIAYGVEGFETFSLDVPDQLRGKSATLKFELESGSSTVYLDDVFFQTNNLLLGNPTEARIKFDYTLLPNENAIDNSNSIYQNNYLMEKPQYTIAYSGTDNTPIWASWQLNKTWLGSGRESFSKDLTLPYNWYKVKDDDYSRDNWTELQIPGAINPANGEPFLLQPGHLVPAADRNRNRKDAYEVSLLSNIIPQHEKNNVSVWRGLEEFSRDIVENRNRELYIIAGGYGTNPGKGVLKAYAEAQYINVPKYLWKVIVVLDKPDQGIADITEDTKVIAVVSPNDEPPLTGGIDPKYQRWYQGGMEIISVRELEERLNSDYINQAREIHYNLLSNVPQEIQDIIETRPFSWTGNDPLNAFSILNANLLAEVGTNLAIPNTTIWHNSITENSLLQIRSLQNGFSQVSVSQTRTPQINSSQVGFGQISSTERGVVKFRSPQISFGQVSTYEVSPAQYTFSEVGISQIGTSQIGTVQSSVTQVSSPQNSTLQKELFQASATQVSTSQIESVQVSSQFKSSEVSFPSSIPSFDFVSIDPDHNWFTQSVYTINSSAIAIWDSLLKPQSVFDINLLVKDLPNGQLAEAQITSFDASGTPNAGTIFIDDDANGKGWFIDSTPLDNSEFAASNAANYFQADINSSAYGKYDLLTTLLHEFAHLYGFIDGFGGFDRRISTKNGIRYFTGDNFVATLDGEHLDKQAHPYDLFNTNLAPGMRKLPSKLDVQILEAILATNNENQKQENAALKAPLTSTPLSAQILNGTFNSTKPTNPNYGWTTRGDSTIVQGQAVLGESDRFNSNFSQSFTIPEGAKYIQFTLTGTQLGASTKYDPADAFEVALLEANTLAPLAGTATGLSQTDALLNIQHDGKAYLSSFVKLKSSAIANDTLTLDSPMTFTVDVSNIAPGTEAKLYFDLLGFGDRTAQVTLDNVRLISGNAIASVATDDTATTNQATPIVLNVLANDSDSDGTIDPTTILINTNPINGTVAINSNGEITYTPNASFIGTDYFTYTVKDDQGEISDSATVTIQVNNVLPTISNIEIQADITEGTTAVFKAIATDSTDDLTYTWNFGDGSDSAIGQTTNHTFSDNGNYTAMLTVTDAFGGTTTQVFSIIVANAAPVVTAGSDRTINEGEAIAFNGSFTDLGILDTHTIAWDFGDGTALVDTLNLSHTYSDNGIYTVTLTVTDNNGDRAVDTLAVNVNNVAPTITDVAKDTQIGEGIAAAFRAVATDPGDDTLTYTWNFGDGSDIVTGDAVNHTFTNNGLYTTTLIVTDSDGSYTSQTLLVDVANAAPVVTATSDRTSITEGDAVTFTGSFTDLGKSDTHTILWDFGDGATESGILNPTHTYADNGVYTATISVTDNDGAISTSSVTININNAAPVVDAGVEQEIYAGESLTFNGSFTDAGKLDTHAIVWDFGDGTTANTLQANHTYTKEGNYTVKLSVTDNAGATSTDTAVVVVKPLPTMTISDRTIIEGNDGNTNAIFTVSLSSPSTKPITVNYATVDGTAIAGSDYTATSGTLTFTPGTTSQTIVVAVTSDRIDEVDETFSVNLTGATNATIIDAQGVGTIVDDDEPPSLTIGNKTIVEGDNGSTYAVFSVSLSAPSAQTVSVNYTTADGTATAGNDYTATNGTLTFAPGSTTATISVQVKGDSIDESDETFLLNLINPTNATIASGQAVGTIVDNDAPPALTIDDTTIVEGSNGITYAVMTVSLSAVSGQTVKVNYATANGSATAGSDYTASSGTLTFAPGQTSQTIKVAINGDRLDETDETFLVNLSNAINATIADNRAIATITDDDAAPLLKVSANPPQLWPPNHKMVEVQVNVAVSDDFDANPAVKLVSITSNEPDNGLGDGDTAKDIDIRPDGRIFLRAERSGTGSGRVYTLTYSATDSAGNVTYSTTEVRVPLNQGK